jgi:lipoprotein-anchoring transpeptidase ErfK/SrfK
MKIFWRTLAIVLFIICTQVPSRAEEKQLLIDIGINQRLVTLYEVENGEYRKIKEYQAATVKEAKDVWKPLGWAEVTKIEIDPWWYPTPKTRAHLKKQAGIDLPEKVRPGSKLNYMGSFKIHLSFRGPDGLVYRIHGNNDPASIGKRITGGCVLLRNDDGLELVKLIKVGTKVFSHL